MKPGFWPDLPKMLETIDDAGYKPGDSGITLRLTGRVIQTGESLSLELDRMKTAVVLRLSPSQEAPETLHHLREKHLGQVVEVEGRWEPAKEKNMPGTLLVASVVNTRTPARRPP